jgi:hypothetical protein
MTSLNALDFGPGGAARFARNAGRSVTGEATGSIKYPSPFFDIAQTYLPTSYKLMLKWCRYYFLTNPIINAVCYKMAEYPVTDLIFDTNNEILYQKWDTLFNSILSYKKFEVEANLDVNVYGNAFVSIFYPFIKLLQCKACKHTVEISRQKYTFRDHKFAGQCQKCGNYGDFRVRDHYVRSVRDIRLIRWNPEYITIQHNEATGENRYFYTIPPTLANDIRMGKRHIIETVPQVFIEALRQNKALLFSKQNIYHIRRPTISQKDKGWGLPMILPVMKQTFYLQILQKSQEAICIEHVVPLRILFPQTSSSSADVYSSVNLSQWRDKIENELVRWRLDNNYIPILPIPVGQQTLGADGKSLMLSQEYRVWTEQIVAGMGVPVEFAFGGLSFSGSSVSLRMLENKFIAQKSQNKQLAKDFIIPNLAAFLGWTPVSCHYKRFKMADDLQRSAFYLQLNQAGKISDESLLEDTDWSFTNESAKIADEQKRVLESQRRQALAQASIQGEAQIVMSKYQARGMKAQQALMPEAPPMPIDPAAAQQMAGIPGQASPEAMGQANIEQQGMANSSGQFDPNIQRQMQQQMQQGAQAPNPEMMGAVQSQLPEAPQMSLGPDGMPQSVNVGLQDLARKLAGQLNQLPDHEKQRELSVMQQKNPQLYSLILQMLQTSTGAEVSSAAKPLPEKKPPRRGPESQIV